VQVPPASEDAIKELLSQPIVAKIATTSKSGDIRITPIWFGVDGDTVLMNTFEDSALVKNLRRNPRCSIIIDTSTFPYHGVHYWGTATVEGPNDDVEGIAKLFTPYRGDVDTAREYARTLIGWGTRVYVRFTATRQTSWDFRG